MEVRNGYFYVEGRQDGTYLILMPPVGGGYVIDPVEAEKYLTNMGIEHEKNAVYDAVKIVTGKKEVRLNTNKCKKIDESADIYLDNEHKSAAARFYPPSSGSGGLLSYEDIISVMTQNGIRYGAKEENIKSFLAERKYCTPYVVAEALEPEEGSDAEIKFHFNTDVSAKPRANEDGSVDFHHLDIINNVQKGQLLASLKPAVQGRPGIDVTGKPIQPRRASVKFLKKSKNIRLSEDGLEAYSEADGHVTLVEGQVFVSDTYLVPANVDASTGDISYKGNVEVAGNVLTGFRIEADGDVIVNGIVEGAQITAGGQIILKRGIQGMGRGSLKAGSNIVSRFIESAEAVAGGYIHTDSIMHSKVEAGEEVTVGGRRGFITGGSIKASSYIIAKTAGSVMGTATVLEVGTMALTAEVHRLEKEKSDLMASLDQINKVINFISRKMKEGEKLSGDKYTQFTTLSAQKSEMENRVLAIDEKIEALHVTIADSNSGYILVDDVIYPGCKVTISGVSTFIRTDTKHCRLVRDGADVRVKAY